MTAPGTAAQLNFPAKNLVGVADSPQIRFVRVRQAHQAVPSSCVELPQNAFLGQRIQQLSKRRILRLLFIQVGLATTISVSIWFIDACYALVSRRCDASRRPAFLCDPEERVRSWGYQRQHERVVVPHFEAEILPHVDMPSRNMLLTPKFLTCVKDSNCAETHRSPSKS